MDGERKRKMKWVGSIGLWEKEKVKGINGMGRKRKMNEKKKGKRKVIG